MALTRKMPAQQPMFTAAQLRRLLLPLMAEQFLAVTMGVADTVMVSGVGEAAVSGVNLVDTINVVLLAAAPRLVVLFNLSAAAQQITVQVLTLFNLVSMVVWPASFVLPNALHAGGDAQFTMAISIFSMWAFRVTLCYWFVLGCGYGLLGVWYAMFTDWTFRAVSFVLRLSSGRWIKKVI